MSTESWDMFQRTPFWLVPGVLRVYIRLVGSRSRLPWGAARWRVQCRELGASRTADAAAFSIEGDVPKGLFPVPGPLDNKARVGSA